MYSKGFHEFAELLKALTYDIAWSVQINLVAAMTAKNKKLHEKEGLELSQNCQVYLSSHLHGQVLHMTIFYLTSALVKKLARQLLNKYTWQGKNCHFSSIYPNLHEQNKLVKEKLSRKNCSCKCGFIVTTTLANISGKVTGCEKWNHSHLTDHEKSYTVAIAKIYDSNFCKKPGLASRMFANSFFFFLF